MAYPNSFLAYPDGAGHPHDPHVHHSCWPIQNLLGLWLAYQMKIPRTAAADDTMRNAGVLLFVWCIMIFLLTCSVTMTTSTTTAQSVSSAWVSHATPSYCRADTSVCVAAALTIFDTRLTTVQYVAPSSTLCCKSVPCVTKRPSAVLP